MRIPKAFIYALLLVLGMGLFIYLDLENKTVPYDDAYSVFMIKSSYADIARITALDVHPPLYYWGLKTFSLVFGDSLFVLRLFSALGVLAALLLSCFSIRKLFGDRVAFFFIVLLLIFPVTQYLITDIRMYSWTMFFVLACGLSAYQVFEKGRVWNWALFFITGLCAAYLHNYGLLSVLGIYSILLAAFIWKKKKWYYLIICGVLFSLAYLPWLFQLVGQLSSVAEDYWIKPLTINDLFLHIYYFYSPKEVWLPFTDFSKVQMMTGLIVIMIIQLILTLKICFSKKLRKDKNSILATLSFVAFLFSVLIGAIISITYLPVLVTRYMTCSFGLFILSLAFVLVKAYEYPKFRSLTYVFLLLLFLDAGLRFYSGMKYYNQTEAAYGDIRSFVKKDQPLVVNDFSYHVMPRLQLIVPNMGCYVLSSDERKESFEPFGLKRMNVKAFDTDKFILVHQEREAIQGDFRKYQASLKEYYVVVDSLHAADFYLYKMVKLDN